VDIRKGDSVEIITGPDRGKRGQVLRAMPKERKVVVEGLNLRKKHSRQQTNTGGGRSLKGGTVEFPAPIHISNVMVICPKCNQPTRVKHLADEGRSVRTCKSCDASLDAK
jgi:large subunit ribosomal protein L24